MPRTSAVECPGCPPLRALTTDVLGLVKVVEARGKAGIPKVVETWGPPDGARGITAASFSDHETQPLMAVARKNNSLEVLNTLSGQALITTKVGEPCSSEQSCEDDPVVGLHFLNTRRIESPYGLNVLLTCTGKGKASLRSIASNDDSSTMDSQSTWDVCKAGKVICSSVNSNEKYALFGGKGVELNVWDLDNCNKTWTSKSPPCNSLGIFSPTWFTAATFLTKEDHHKIVAGTNNFQVRLYDISAQRRPVISINFRESTIKTVTPDLDGNRIYAGTGSGDLASFDMRTGKLLGCFVGKCCGSIRSIAKHPEKPILASCGLDSYLRIWNTNSRQLLSAVFLKQHLTNVMFDSHFTDEGNTDDQPSDFSAAELIETKENDDHNDDDDELWLKKHDKGKLKNKEKKANKGASQQDKLMEEDQSFSLSEDDAEELSNSKRRKASSEENKRTSKKSKKSKSKGA